jgi:hypothetical protein
VSLRAVLTPMLLLAGCIESFDGVDPEVGGARAERCVDADSDPDKEISFSKDVRPILHGEVSGVPGCSCHLPDRPNPIGFEQAGLDLSSYAKLREGGVRSRSAIVVSGKPCSSILWQKVSAGPPFGARMPFDGPPFLGAEQRRILADWIAEGAREN